MSMLFGVIEGFYGRQWSWQQRHELVELLPILNCNAYCYAPKGDPLLRRLWRDAWPETYLSQLSSLATVARKNRLSFGIGLSVLDYSQDDSVRLRQKIEQLNTLDLGHLGIFFDDMRGDDEGLLDKQLGAVDIIRRHSNAEQLLFCPTYYSTDPVLENVFGPRPENYWSRLSRELPLNVQCFWTGQQVCSERIDQNDAASAMRILGRRPALWDNYPVNDGRLTSRFLHLRPHQGRKLPPHCYQSYFINPMNQFELSLPVIAAAHLCVAGQKGGQQRAFDFAQHRWGASFADFWWQNTPFVQDMGLDEMPLAERENMLRCLSSFKNLAAKEWLDWLHGGYTFDPACLTS